MLRQIIATVCVAVLFAGPVFAGEATVTINKISSDGIGAAIGTIDLKDGHHGLTITPDLRDLPFGNHAFHIHENPDCGPGMKTERKSPA